MTVTYRYPARFIIFASLLAIPFVRMLLNKGYGFFYIEVLFSFMVFAAVAAILAGVTRTTWVFHTAVIAIAVASSGNALHIDILPYVKFRWILPGMALLLFGCLLLLKQRFYTLLLVFLVGSLAPDLAKALFSGNASRASASTAKGEYKHVVHIILDEMMGLSGAPPDCAECVRASARLATVLENANFRIYPNAFSNYRSTRDSIPSILNGRLLRRTGEFINDEDLRPYLHRNAYFEHYLQKGYAIRAYESDYIIYSAPEYPSVRARMYETNDLKALHRTHARWPERMHQLFTIYVQSDALWWYSWIRIAPPSLQAERLPVGPLALEKIWPDHILQDFRSAQQNTLFFAHLMTPHSPYVLNADGSVRDHADWKSHQDHWVPGDDPGEYRRRYRLYGTQAQAVAEQVRSFLSGLKASGLYDQTTIVIHGDHGSRLRLLRPEERDHRRDVAAVPGPTPIVSRYDYVAQPDDRDLLNRFAALLAVKLPRSSTPEIVTESGSILHFLQETFHYAPAIDSAADLDSVYLFTPAGEPRKIAIQQAFGALNAPVSVSILEEKNEIDHLYSGHVCCGDAEFPREGRGVSRSDDRQHGRADDNRGPSRGGNRGENLLGQTAPFVQPGRGRSRAGTRAIVFRQGSV